MCNKDPPLDGILQGYRCCMFSTMQGDCDWFKENSTYSFLLPLLVGVAIQQPKVLVIDNWE